MTGPLVLLAIPSALVGLAIGYPPENGLLHHWLAPVFEKAVEASGKIEAPYNFFGIDGSLAIGTTAFIALAIILAWRLFGIDIPALGLRAQPRPAWVDRAAHAPVLRLLYRGSAAKWWFDDLNDLLFVRLGGRLAAACQWFDSKVVDGSVNGVGRVTVSAGGELRQIQTGRVQNYALGIALGLILVAAGFFIVAIR